MKLLALCSAGRLYRVSDRAVYVLTGFGHTREVSRLEAARILKTALLRCGDMTREEVRAVVAAAAAKLQAEMTANGPAIARILDGGRPAPFSFHVVAGDAQYEALLATRNRLVYDIEQVESGLSSSDDAPSASSLRGQLASLDRTLDAINARARR